MDRDEILEIMEESDQERIEYTDKDGVTRTGYVDVFESRYDNDGEASLCFAGDEGEMLIVYESDIAEIKILTDESSPE